MAGNVEKKKETEQLYFELKPKVKLDNFEIKHDQETIERLQEFHDQIIKNSEAILKHEPHAIYAYISNGSFFPKYQHVFEASKNTENSFLNFVTTIQFDRNKNISRPSARPDQNRICINMARKGLCLLVYLRR